MTNPNHRKQRANNSREHILDTYVDLLIRSGERAATLDAVATTAKVSKGGLLYHFSSKKALLEALAERFWVTACTTTRRSEATPPTRRGQPPSRQTVQRWSAPCRFSRLRLTKSTQAARCSG